MHRDIKPSNLFLKFENDECIIKLADFGISRYYNDTKNDKFQGFSNINSNTNNVGTPLFTAPEIIKDESYNYKIDLYSLGVTLFYLMIEINEIEDVFKRFEKKKN